MSIKFLSIILILLTAAFMIGCSWDSAQAEKNRKISPQEARRIMNERKDYILVDVRTPQEYKSGHIEGALLIPDYEIKGTEVKELPDKDALILLYCRSGRRSAEVAQKMLKMGYTNLYDFGGIIDWTYEIKREE